MKQKTSEAVLTGNAVPRKNVKRDVEVEVATIVVVGVRRTVGNSVKNGQVGKGRPLLRTASVGMRLLTLIVRR